MKRLILLVSFLLACSSCGLLSNSPQQDSPIDWPVLAKCGPDTSDLVAVVSRILLDNGGMTQQSLSERAHSELEKLAREHGPETVACLVDYWIGQWTEPGAAVTPERVEATKRAQAFMGEIGTEIEHVPQ